MSLLTGNAFFFKKSFSRFPVEHDLLILLLLFLFD